MALNQTWDLSPGWLHCIVFLGKTLLSQRLLPPLPSVHHEHAGLASHPGGSRNTLSWFMFQKPLKALVYVACLFSQLIFQHVHVDCQNAEKNSGRLVIDFSLISFLSYFNEVKIIYMNLFNLVDSEEHVVSVFSLPPHPLLLLILLFYWYFCFVILLLLAIVMGLHGVQFRE